MGIFVRTFGKGNEARERERGKEREEDRDRESEADWLRGQIRKERKEN